MNGNVQTAPTASPRSGRSPDLGEAVNGPRVEGSGPDLTGRPGYSAVAWRNIRIMRLLERIAARFDEDGVPVMALKGAALQLVLFDRPDARPMSDVDLLVRPEHAEQACRLLESMGGLRGESLVREDFFPKYHYEMEYAIGTIHPVKIDLHVRPFRPLRYAQLVPDDALWSRCHIVALGQSRIGVPGPEDMLIHLAVHAAVHGAERLLWLQDVRQWIEAHGHRLDWPRLLSCAEAWGLALPLRRVLRKVEGKFGPLCPPHVLRRLANARVSWRDRLALWQAPRDAQHPAAQMLVNTLCTRGLRFKLGYLSSILWPSWSHMADWYGPPHRGWPAVAHLLRWLAPLAVRTRLGRGRLSHVELRPSPLHGLGVFATRDIAAGDVIAQCVPRPVEQDGMYVMRAPDDAGRTRRFELTGKLKYLNHACGPNARLDGARLMALCPITHGREITIDYGPGSCDCATRQFRTECAAASVSTRVA